MLWNLRTEGTIHEVFAHVGVVRQMSSKAAG
jgi:hypothetical protein